VVAKAWMIGVEPHQGIAILADLVAVCHDHPHIDMVE